jgi:hypothetical protein
MDASSLFAAAFLAILPALDICFRPFIEWTECYCTHSADIWYMMPGWLYLPLWIIAYGFAVAAEMIFMFLVPFCCEASVDPMYVSILALWLFHIVLGFWFKTVFFKKEMHGFAAVICGFYLISAMALTVLYGLAMPYAGVLPFVFFMINLIWVIMIFVMCMGWVANVESPRKAKKAERYGA